MFKKLIFFVINLSLFASFPLIKTPADLTSFFPQSITDVEKKKNEVTQEFIEKLEEAIQTPFEESSFSNVVVPIDTAIGQMGSTIELFQMLSMLHTNEKVRKYLSESAQELANFKEEFLLSHPEVYETLQRYYDNPRENLSAEKLYYLKNILQELNRLGLSFSDKKRNRLIQLKKKLNELTTLFDKNIIQDQKFIEVSENDLKSMAENFLLQLKKNESGLYILGTDYPTVFPVLSECQNKDVREKVFHVFQNLGYPENLPILEEIIEQRQLLAEEFGFDNFSQYQLHDLMIKTPERAKEFLNDLFAYASKKEQVEFEQLINDLPESVSINESGKMEPWDIAFCQNQYKEKCLDFDNSYIAEHFTLDTAINGFIDIFEQFLDVQISKVEIKDLWAEELFALKVSKQGELLGYIILDLFPRPMKYNHACMCPIIPAWDSENIRYPSLNIVVANFPAPTSESPSFLSLDNMRTLFHELGHAFHDLMGESDMILTCGTNVKRDFVELPSQLMEEWLWERDVLKRISSHYETGKPLSDALIEKILSSRSVDIGYFLERQIFFAMLSLQYFSQNVPIDTQKILKDVHDHVRNNYQYYDKDHRQASFGHLTGYGASYYGYLWTKVIALDFFEKIKQEGIDNPLVGNAYIEKVIGQGGKKDPNEIIQDFLGREVSLSAFLKRTGIDCQ
ncbi:MAG: M3 family metallopeptidase [Chlamydiota bacterium]|jgi:thimet oligopeptidase